MLQLSLEQFRNRMYKPHRTNRGRIAYSREAQSKHALNGQQIPDSAASQIETVVHGPVASEIQGSFEDRLLFGQM